MYGYSNKIPMFPLVPCSVSSRRNTLPPLPRSLLQLIIKRANAAANIAIPEDVIIIKHST